MAAGPDLRPLPEGDAAARGGDAFEPHDEQVLKLRVTVTDTGTGIPEEAHQRLFQAFSQVDSSTTRRYGGTGLGLAISRRLVELMGGTIGFSSNHGGTTFYFSVQLAVPALPPEPPQIPDELRELRVLVVDDHQLVRELLCSRLSGWGMRPESATDAGQALSILRDAHYAGPPFAIAIVDLEMPGTDGLGLIRAIRSDPDLAGIQLIALASLARRGPSQEAKKLGARVCLTKPVQSVKLLDALLVVTGRREANEPETRSLSAPLRDGARVLVAEDNLVNRRLALAQLAQFGLQADAVTNGREALAALEKARYDLVLMDGQMPELDGYGATAELRRREAGTGKHMVVIAMTADALVGDRERCLAAGMDDYLAKPVKVPDLRAMLAKWLKLKQPAKPPAPEPAKDGSNRWAKTNEPHTGRHEGGDSTSRFRRVVKDSDGLDPTVIEDLLSQGGRELLGQLTEALRQEGPTLLAKIGEAMGRGDAEAANAAVHRLKGSAWSLGMRDLASACLSLEHALAAGMADVERLRQEVAGEYERALAGLDRIVQNGKG
jgi:CheY-like chemotaxis protein/HPt (histidine-containing phosphotransfer) domain-containing protein